MKHDSPNGSGPMKVTALPAAFGDVRAPGETTPKRIEAPAPPPTWTRYIDSRLKQFCVR